MKKLSLPLMLLLAGILARGQEYVPLINENSEWIYDVNPFIGCMPCLVQFQQIKIVGDTLIHSKNCFILEKHSPGKICDDMGSSREYIYQEDQIVYWYNRYIDEFTILYDFTAEKGETWEIKVSNCSFTVHVDSISSISIEGLQRKVIYVSDERNYFTGSIIEQIGHTVSMFPKDIFYDCDDTACDSDFIYGLRCYLDNGDLIFKKGEIDCDSVYEPGQAYHPLIQEDAVWSVSHLKFTFKGDTLINDIAYKKLYYHDSIPDFNPEKLKYVAALRESILDGKVWMIFRNTDTERLLYDFSLLPGDKSLITTLYLDFDHEWSDIFVEQEIEILSIDEIVIDGEPRKRLTLKSDFTDWENEYWIEGIGSSSGLVFPGNSFSTFGIADFGYPDLLCYSINTEIIYRNELFDTCFQNPSGVSVKEEMEQIFNIKAFLYNDNTILLSGNFNLTRVEIFDLTGRIIVQKNFNEPSNEHYISIPNINRGMYIVKAYSNNNQALLKILR